MKKNEKYKLKKIKEREEFERSITGISEDGKNILREMYDKIEHRKKFERRVILGALGGAALLALGGYGVKKGYDLMKENVSVEFENPIDEEMPNSVSSNEVEETVSSNDIENTVSSNDVKPEEEPEENKNTKKIDTKNYKGKSSIKSLLEEMDLPDDKEFRAELAVLYGIVDKPEDYKATAEQNAALFKAIMEQGLVLVLDDNGNIIGFKTDEEDSKTYELSDEVSKQITDKVNSIVNQKPSSKPNHKTTTGNKEEQNKEQQTTDQTDQSQENTDDNNLNQGQGGNSGGNQGQGGNSGGNHNSGNPNQGGNSGGNTSGETPVNPDPPIDPIPEEPDPTERPDITDPGNTGGDNTGGGTGGGLEEDPGSKEPPVPTNPGSDRPDITDPGNTGGGNSGGGLDDSSSLSTTSSEAVVQPMSFVSMNWTEEIADFEMENSEGMTLVLTKEEDLY